MSGWGDVSAERFVRAWQQGTSVAAVAKELGMDHRTCSSRAGSYRRVGIPLKKFGSQNRPLNKEALRKLARSLQ